MNITKHAAERIQQRAISRESLEILMMFGDELRGSAGATILCIDSKQTRHEVEALWQAAKNFDLADVLGAYVVVSGDCRVLTVARRRKRLLRNRVAH